MKLFYHILINTLVVSIVDYTLWFAITFYVYLQTRSVFATGIISGIYLVLTAGSGFWLGSIVDHYKKKHAMLLSSIVSLVLYVICFAIYITAAPGTFKDPSNPLLWVFVLILMIGVLAGNIRTIALPTIVTILFPPEKRDKANGMSGTAFGISFLITSVISGFLVAHSGMYLALLLGIFVSLATIIHLWMIHIPEKGVVHVTEQSAVGTAKDTAATGQMEGAKGKVDIRGTIKIIAGIPGLFALIFFTTFNNFLGGVFMALMDAYGLSLVSVQVWGLIWGVLSTGFIVGGIIISKKGLGRNPLRAMMLANLILWFIASLFTIQSHILLLTIGMYIYMCIMPYIEASEQTIIQKVVPHERQGRVFGFAQSMEQMASPLTAFLIGPITQFFFIPFMTTGAGVDMIGGWFGTGADRGIALVFTLTGIIGFIMTFLAMRTRHYRLLSNKYLEH